MFCKEVVTWKALRHPNVMPLIGATMAETQFTMVSDWMTNGNISEFVKAHPDADRIGLVRVPLEFALSSRHAHKRFDDFPSLWMLLGG